MSSAAVNQFSALPNSAGAGGSAVEAYSGYVFGENLDLWIAGAGGHTNSSDNRVVMYDLSKNVPTGWDLKKASSTVVQSNVPYYSDGLPVSTHTYDYSFWCPAVRSIIRFGAFGIYETGFGSNTIDGFNVDTNQWAAAGTYPKTRGTNWANDPYNYGATQDKSTGNILWADNGSIMMWVPGQSTFTAKSATSVGLVRFPNCWDSARNAIFSLAWADGQAAGSGVTCWHTANPSSSTPTRRAITFNASAAFTQFQADQPAYAGMDYDALRDKFYFAFGTSGGVSGPLRIYEITPNSGTTWDMAIYTPTAGNAGSVSTNGLNGRFKYVQRGGIGGFVVMTDKPNGLYFLRTT
jgi:hypothetical protein